MAFNAKRKLSPLVLEGTRVFRDGIELLNLVYRTISLRPVRETDE